MINFKIFLYILFFLYSIGTIISLLGILYLLNDYKVLTSLKAILFLIFYVLLFVVGGALLIKSIMLYLLIGLLVSASLVALRMLVPLPGDENTSSVVLISILLLAFLCWPQTIILNIFNFLFEIDSNK